MAVVTGNVNRDTSFWRGSTRSVGLTARVGVPSDAHGLGWDFYGLGPFGREEAGLDHHIRQLQNGQPAGWDLDYGSQSKVSLEATLYLPSQKRTHSAMTPSLNV